MGDPLVAACLNRPRASPFFGVLTYPQTFR